ncbi:type VI secretion system contractile sheath large subunit [Burkholderiales bacterium]|nr:type VI secretion system contractile sheath large subunit [Burkholderiales bacterium]
MAENMKTDSAGAPASADTSLLEKIIADSKVAHSDTEKTRAKELINQLVQEVMDGKITVSDNIIASIESRIAAIDEAVSEQLTAVLHDESFKTLEASWRGLHYLVSKSETGTGLKIKMFNATKAELIKDFKAASEFDQSTMFKQIYEEEYGTFGGSPYAVILGDYEFGKNPEDLFLLEEISHVAAAAHAPFISAASPQIMGLESFSDLSKPRDLAKVFDTVEYAKWHSFRDSEDSRYVALALPHVLGRLPYGPDTLPVEAFDYKEDVSGQDNNKFLWVNAAYSLGTRMTDAYAKYGWCTAIRGVEGGGMVEGLPVYTFSTDDGDVALQCPTQIAITDRREKELADLGFIPLVHCKGTDYAAFFSVQSTQSPKEYDTDEANANSRLSAQIQYIMASSRFAHYLKSMMRDKIGSFASRADVNTFLNGWINNYILANDEGSQELKAQYPLREARIDVTEVPGKPGMYRAVAFLKPHFQLEGLTASLRMVADLPPAANG